MGDFHGVIRGRAPPQRAYPEIAVGPQSTAPQNDNSERPYKPPSVALIIVKAVVIAVVLVGMVTYGTRLVFAILPP